MSSSLRGAAGKSLSAQAWDGITVFLVKTAFPLIPIALVVWLVGAILNAEVAGTYRGMTPITGAMELELNEDNDLLSGYVIFKANDRYDIESGKMLDDNKMQLKLVQASGPSENDKKYLVFDGTKEQNILLGTIHAGVQTIPIRLTRSSTSSFFGKRWLTRTMNYFGTGIKLQ